MTNNDILRRVRYVFDFNDTKMIAVFGQVEETVTREQISEWLKKDDDSAYKSLSDTQLAIFLNGLIVEKRGKKEGSLPVPEKQLNNNIVFRKLKIALDLKNEDVLDILSLASLKISKHELSAFFRRQDHKHFRVCKDQILRNFLNGLQLKHRPGEKPDAEFSWT
ncbi:Glutamate synthase [NADPH] large chain [hydrothermal vent metagenome]|uniref:Glutamate synthase [NADPH] large chain n=1 Tax=hydrothermal vent metagenome TaxID=652676 RepID=A0A3B0WUY7_9ZZZZ